MSEQEKKKRTILIVDDEADVLWFISKMFQPQGYETLTAGSGMEALKIIQECHERIDVVILDLRMPGMGGMDVLKSIRTHQPELAVIILTALHEKRRECEEIGVEAFVKKPYSLKDLGEKVETVIEKRLFEKKDFEIGADQVPAAKILIVDDEPEVCEILGEALEKDIEDAHFEVQYVHSGDDALRLSVEFEPDIAIVDIKMPHMWGDELIRRFRAGEGCPPKDFVIYTSITNPEEIERAKQLEHKFLSKPTNLEVLVDVLKKICVKHNLLKPKQG